MRITKITYKGGMIKSLNEKESLPALTFGENEIPGNILEIITDINI